MLNDWIGIGLFSAGALCVVSSLIVIPWSKLRSLKTTSKLHPAFFPTYALLFLGVGCVAAAGVLISIRENDVVVAALSSGIVGFVLGCWVIMSGAHDILKSYYSAVDAQSPAKGE
jgi:hypothetical protein